jgi:hypothetical protein
MLWQGDETVLMPARSRLERVRGQARATLVDMTQEAIYRILLNVRQAMREGGDEAGPSGGA